MQTCQPPKVSQFWKSLLNICKYPRILSDLMQKTFLRKSFFMSHLPGKIVSPPFPFIWNLADAKYTVYFYNLWLNWFNYIWRLTARGWQLGFPCTLSSIRKKLQEDNAAITFKGILTGWLLLFLFFCNEMYMASYLNIHLLILKWKKRSWYVFDKFQIFSWQYCTWNECIYWTKWIMWP